MMKFLADESCDFAIVRALRSAGYQVTAVSERQHRSLDKELMELAYRERRIILTEDKDFGWLAYVALMDNPGVILFRFPGNARAALAASAVRVVTELQSGLEGAFIVVRPGSIRVSRREPSAQMS
jgi:predicted nuclease of predicted toxin-antitoxin system